MKVADLVAVYTAIIWPVVEYAAAAWHSMLTCEQSEELECQQVQALKNILGPGISARIMREELKVEPLSVRRSRAVLRFSTKCCNNDRFSNCARSQFIQEERGCAMISMWKSRAEQKEEKTRPYIT